MKREREREKTHDVKFSRCRDAPPCILALENASLQRVARTGRHVCTRKCVVHIYVCVHEDTFETRMVTVFDHPSSRNDCNPSIRPPKPIYQTQVELSRSSLCRPFTLPFYAADTIFCFLSEYFVRENWLRRCEQFRAR